MRGTLFQIVAFFAMFFHEPFSGFHCFLFGHFLSNPPFENPIFQGRWRDGVIITMCPEEDKQPSQASHHDRSENPANYFFTAESTDRLLEGKKAIIGFIKFICLMHFYLFGRRKGDEKFFRIRACLRCGMTN